MGERVVANHVSSFGNLTRNLGALADVASNEEKSCANFVIRQDFQQTQGVGIVGAIVIGERHLPGSVGQAGEGAPVPLPGGRHRLVAGGGQRGGGGGGGENSEHGAIVTDWVIGKLGN